MSRIHTFVSAIRTLVRSLDAPSGAGRGPRQPFRSNSGQTIVLVALLAPIFIAMAGFAIDYGISAGSRSDSQNAADASALAGAGVLHNGGSVAEAQKAALSWAEKNGLGGDETTINIPPTSGSHRGDSNYVEVLIARSQNTVFMRAVRVDTVDIGARAVAGFPTTTNGNSGYSLLALNPSSCRSFNKNGVGTLNIINGGGVMVNSTCSNTSNGALNRTGSGSVNA
jgi:Flp pilus assembly protein TadG